MHDRLKMGHRKQIIADNTIKTNPRYSQNFLTSVSTEATNQKIFFLDGQVQEDFSQDLEVSREKIEVTRVPK